MSRYYADLTVIDIGVEKGSSVKVIQLIEDDLNGSRFALLFIKAKLGLDLKDCFKHRELMYDC